MTEINMTQRWRGWGHEVLISTADRGQTYRGIMIVTPAPRVGDYVILSTGNPDKPTTRYQVETCRPCSDPADNYAVTLRFAPRQAGQ